MSDSKKITNLISNKMNININQIKEIISNYEKLYDLAIHKIEVISKLDREYNTRNKIVDISFYNDVVSVTCDDSWGGCHDIYSFDFPTIWLSKTDTELEEIVVSNRELKAEKLRKQKEEKELKAKKEWEEKELEQYNRLKAKFDKN